MGPNTTITARTVGRLGAVALSVPLAGATSAALAQDPAPAAPAPSAAPAPVKAHTSLTLSDVRRNVTVGRRGLLTGKLRDGGASGAHTVALQVRAGSGWTTVDRDRTSSATGAYRLSWATSQPGSRAARVVFAGDGTAVATRRSAGRLNTYRRVFVSYYGPGLYGSHLACGGSLSSATLGVANKTLPCGTKVTLRYRGRSIRVPVVDRGPYVGGREYDLTSATRQRLGFGSTGTVLATK